MIWKSPSSHSAPPLQSPKNRPTGPRARSTFALCPLPFAFCLPFIPREIPKEKVPPVAIRCYTMKAATAMPLKPFTVTNGDEKKIFLLKPRGFCAGVVRAIDVVEIALDLYGPPVYVRKEIVHNKHVVDELRE